ncbi:MAG: hypothetical protein Q9223_006339, partial [Gallowayella weberi]
MTNFALKLRNRGHTDISLYYISTHGLFANTLQVSYDYVTVYIPVLQSHDCTFISVADLRSILCVDLHRQHKSEWLVLNRLPQRLAAPHQTQSLLNLSQPVPNQAHPPIHWAQLVEILGQTTVQDIFGPNAQTMHPNTVIDWSALVHMLGPVALQILGPNAQAIDPQAHPLGPTHAAVNAAIAMNLLQPLFPSAGPSANGNPGEGT